MACIFCSYYIIRHGFFFFSEADIFNFTEIRDLNLFLQIGFTYMLCGLFFWGLLFKKYIYIACIEQAQILIAVDSVAKKKKRERESEREREHLPESY